MIRVGDRAPEFMLPAVGGGQVSLKDFRGRPILLTFIRHIGWPFCLTHVARVRARQQDLDAANATSVVLAAEPLGELEEVAREEGWTGPVLADPLRRIYRSYGLFRLPWYRVFTPKAAVLYLGMVLGGRSHGKPGQDMMQQGGDFILDSAGIVHFASVTRRSYDRPPVDELVRCLRTIVPPPAATLP